MPITQKAMIILYHILSISPKTQHHISNQMSGNYRLFHINALSYKMKIMKAEEKVKKMNL